MKDKLTLVLLGRSGCGKGTQAKFILRRLKKARHIETGRFIREIVKRYNNETSRIMRETLKEGRLAPAWIPAYSWIKKFVEKGYAQDHLIYDGAPRMVWEARLLDEVLKWHGRVPALCLYIDISEKEAMRRLLLRGRKDDNKHAIKNRLKFFRREVLRTLDYFKSQRRLIHIDGSPPPDKVWEEIENKLTLRLGKWKER